MKKSSLKFKKFLIAFAVVFFLLIGGLTYYSNRVDALLYPVVTCATPSKGSLDPREDLLWGNGISTVVPTASVRDGVLWYAQKNEKGEYYVHTTQVQVMEQTAIYTKLEEIDSTISMVICDSNKEIHDGDRVLVKAGVM